MKPTKSSQKQSKAELLTKYPKWIYSLRVLTMANEVQWYPAKKSGEKGRLRLINLVKKHLGIIWKEAAMYNFPTDTLLEGWHYEIGEMSANEYVDFQKNRKKEKPRPSLLKLSVFFNRAFSQQRIRAGKRSSITAYSIDVDVQNGNMGYAVALNSLREFLLHHKFRNDVERACVWTIANEEMKNKMVAVIRNHDLKINYRDALFEHKIKGSGYRFPIYETQIV